MSRISFLGGGSVLALAISCGFAGQALAQSAPPTAGPVSHTIDEIVVTAQKRSESLQNVPIVVTAVSKQLLRDTGVRDIKDLTIVVPGLMVTSTQNEGATTARIRGVGTVGDNLGLESSVGIQIDGVYRPRNSVSFGDLGDLERIEVLKGPQGTLFGKNTSAGVINVITRKPSFENEAEVEAIVSNFNGFGGSVSVTGPMVDDKVAGRLFIASRKRDGFYEVRTGSGPRTNPEDSNQSFYTARGQVLFTPTDGFDLNLTADITSRREDCCAGLQIFNGPSAALVQALDPAALGPSHGGLARPASPFDRVAYLNRDTHTSVRDGGVSAEANWRTDRFGGAVVTSITAWRDWKRGYSLDADYTTADILFFSEGPQNRSEFKQFSQELRMAGGGKAVDWLVGAFFADEEFDHNLATRYGRDFETYASLALSQGTNPALLPVSLLGRAPGTSYASGQGQSDHFDQHEDNLALFTNDTWHVTDAFDLTAGLRYTREHKSLHSLYTNTDNGVGCATFQARLGQSPNGQAIGPTLCTSFANSLFNDLRSSQDLKEEKFTGTVKAAYRLSPEVMTYVSYARGYKAGGFNLDRQACGYAVNATTTACAASIVASGRALVANPFQSAANQASLQPVLDTSFKPEMVDSYELGMKNTLLQRRLLLNATAFYQKYTGFQLNAFNGLTFAVSSIPEVVSKGVDADVVFLPMPGLTLQGGLTYADTRYADKDAAVLGPRCVSLAPGAVATAGSPAGCSLLPGSRLSLAPLYSATLAVSYEHDVGADLTARFNVSARSVSSYNTGSDLNPMKVQDAFTVVNARIGLGARDLGWALELWAQNLLDQNYYQVAFDAPVQTGSYNAYLGQPRTWGATLRARF